MKGRKSNRPTPAAARVRVLCRWRDSARHSAPRPKRGKEGRGEPTKRGRGKKSGEAATKRAGAETPAGGDGAGTESVAVGTRSDSDGTGRGAGWDTPKSNSKICTLERSLNIIVELKQQWNIETSKRLVVVFDFDTLAEVAEFTKPFISATKGPAVIDLSDKGVVALQYTPKKIEG